MVKRIQERSMGHGRETPSPTSKGGVNHKQKEKRCGVRSAPPRPKRKSIDKRKNSRDFLLGAWCPEKGGNSQLRGKKLLLFTSNKGILIL